MLGWYSGLSPLN